MEAARSTTRGPTATTGHPLRVLVAGISWPIEPFVERLVVGLAQRGVALALRSRLRPPSRWLARHRVGWEYGGSAPLRDLVWRQTQHHGALAAVRTLAGSRHRALSRSATDRGHADVVYVPWLNALMDDPELFDLGIPVVTSCRGSLVNIAPWDPGRPGYPNRLRGVFDRATFVHCVSENILDEAVALGLDRAEATVIHPAVDPELFRPASVSRTPDGGPCRVVSTGSLVWLKDGEHALRAIARAVDAGADLTFEIIGAGEDVDHLRFAIDDLGLTQRVRLLGKLPPEGVAARLHYADVFLHASCAEGVSNAVLEAMATGLPVITTEAGGMREAVRDGLDGVVVPVRGTEAMAEALVSLAADPQRRANLGRSARQRVVESFRLDQQIDAFVALLGDAARSGGRS